MCTASCHSQAAKEPTAKTIEDFTFPKCSTKRQSSNKNGTGSNINLSETKLIAVPKNNHIFVLKLSPFVDQSDVEKHLKVDIKNVSCDRLQSKYNKYSSVKSRSQKD